MGDYLQTGKPSRHITNTEANSPFHPLGAGKSCLAAVKAEHVRLCRVAGNIMSFHMTGCNL